MDVNEFVAQRGQWAGRKVRVSGSPEQRTGMWNEGEYNISVEGVHSFLPMYEMPEIINSWR